MLFDIVGPEFAQIAHQAASAGQMPLLGLGQTFCLRFAKANLHRFIAIAILAAHLRHNARAKLDHRYWDGLARRAKDLGHPNFAA